MDIKLLLLIVLFVVVIVCDYPLTEGLFIEDWQTVDFSSYEENMDMTQEHYEELMNNFRNIFPTGNRNAGGPQFYEYIYSHKDTLTKDKFMLYNKFYCGVSGSPIDPSRGKVYDYVKMNHIDSRVFVGKYYRCCWPCLADIMAHAKVEHHTVILKDGPYEHMVITINDPCLKQDKLPSEVSSYNCENNKTTNGIRTESGRLIIAVLHDHKLYDKEKHDTQLQPVLELCKERMNTPIDKLRGGMGDIFVKLANI